jgi:TM2 domain-containing membrane protein YozV
LKAASARQNSYRDARDMKPITSVFVLLWFLVLIFAVHRFYWGESVQSSLFHLWWGFFGGVVALLVLLWIKKKNSN